MIEFREIIIGLILGGIIAGIIFGVIYLPGYFQDQSLPPKQNVKFLSISDYSFRDWALRLDDDNLSVPHSGYFRSHLIVVPILLKDLSYTDDETKTRRIFGQFESIGQKTELFGKFEAAVPEHQPVNVKVELFSGKFSDMNVSGNRISGQINIIEDTQSNEINGVLQIGSTNYGGIPFGGTNLRFNGDLNEINADLTTQVSGHQGTSVELSGAFVQQNFLNIRGILNITSLPDLIKTIQMIASGQETNIPSFVSNLKNMQIQIEQDMNARLDANAVKFNILTSLFGDEFKAAAILDKSKELLQLGARFEDYWQYRYPYNLQKTAGHTRTQAIAELSLNQQNDDVFGPFTTRLEDVTLEMGKFSLRDINALITYKTLTPLKVENFKITANEMFLDEPLQDIEMLFSESEDRGLQPNSISAIWNGKPSELVINFKEDQKLPDLNVKNTYQNLSEIADLLQVNLEFSAPVEFSKTWHFNGEFYESEDLTFKNAEPGILTLNENVPELTNIYVKNMDLKLEDGKTLALQVRGTHPLLYGQKPVRIETKLERHIE